MGVWLPEANGQKPRGVVLAQITQRLDGAGVNLPFGILNALEQ